MHKQNLTLNNLQGLIKHKQPSLLLLPGPLWPGVVVPVRVASMGQIELFNHLLYLKQTITI